jgi:acylphosphatase
VDGERVAAWWTGPVATVRQRAVVSGRVQGVFFRASTRRRADELGVTGWVRNLPDGRVELAAEGPLEAVGALLDWAGNGPPQALVTSVDVVEEPPTGATGFEVR